MSHGLIIIPVVFGNDLVQTRKMANCLGKAVTLQANRLHALAVRLPVSFFQAAG